MILSADFLSVLEGIGVVNSSAHTAVGDNDSAFRHCLRCHQPYMERDNGPRSCAIPHTATYNSYWNGSSPTAVVSCGAALTMNATLASVHFTGHRTMSLENVEYNPISANTC
ncbi:uncharacterized protein F5147DRAFT_581005 [Suillus discolor]|uniref:Uncharacterized protein n=1 Tax=Suillus discolor TaxID=1912936 RepID=A0A9P7JRY3_9AGAM|nr:uncharacterized protein F5147DRAFT_581005 [Suillus discolor]KAG2102570.1 hypothetical protein F5147DRAFT_581005 [Suillus discolor]